MPKHFGTFLLTHNWLKVLRAILSAEKGVSIREIIDLTELSPGGAQDVLRRLKEHNLITSTREGKRILYFLALSEKEKELLEALVSYQNESQLRDRAEIFSSRYANAVAWIDESVETWRSGKRQLRNTSIDSA